MNQCLAPSFGWSNSHFKWTSMIHKNWFPSLPALVFDFMQSSWKEAVLGVLDVLANSMFQCYLSTEIFNNLTLEAFKQKRTHWKSLLIWKNVQRWDGACLRGRGRVGVLLVGYDHCAWAEQGAWGLVLGAVIQTNRGQIPADTKS